MTFEPRVLDSVQMCGEGTFLNNTIQSCVNCTQGCKSCNDSITCNSCYDGYNLTTHANQSTYCNKTNDCITEGYFWNSTTMSCENLTCSDHCTSCYYNISTQQSDCSTCKSGYELIWNDTLNNNECGLIDCNQTGVYPIEDTNGFCEYCMQGCQSCDGIYECNQCKQNYQLISYGWDYIHNHTYQMCNANCSLGQYMSDYDKGFCSNCSISCTSCLNSSYCYECGPGFFLSQYQDNDGQTSNKCESCPQKNCRSCSYNPMQGNLTNSSVNCYYCEDGFMVDWGTNTCTAAPECEIGQYYDQSDSKCKQCLDQNCLSCGQFTNCSMCASGYNLSEDGQCISICNNVGEFYDLTTQKCVSCADSDHCLQCSDDQSCDICKSGSQLYENITDGLTYCTKCSDNCAYCSANASDATSTCKICQNNYMLNTTTSQCESYDCEQGKYFDSIWQTCSSCPPGCSSCSDPYTCTSCIYKNQTLVNGSCIDACSWQMHQHYQLYNSSIYLYFNLTTNQCQNCSIESCSTCYSDSAAESEKCAQCEFGYEKSPDNSTCKPISCEQQGVYQNGSLCDYCSQGCLTCSSRYTCTKCMNEMFVDVYGQCQPLCSNNQFYNYTLQGCQTCGDENCSYCDSHTGQCAYCGFGQTLWKDLQSNDSYQMKCLSCAQNCQSCNLTDQTDPSSLTCTSCSAYFKKDGQGSCIPYDTCPTNEYFEQNCTKCSKCDSICASCQNFSSNCTTCAVGMQLKNVSINSSTCERICADGMFYDPLDTSCKTCKENCESCSNSSNCAQCNQGYAIIFDPTLPYSDEEEIEGATCEKCPSNCNDCLMDSSGEVICMRCDNGYGLVQTDGTAQCLKQTCKSGKFYDQITQRCRDCSSHCSECSSTEMCTKCESNQFDLNVTSNQCYDKCQKASQDSQIYQYYNEKTQQCQTCGVQNCTFCSNQTNCFNCDKGYSLLNGINQPQCLLCPNNCSQCNLTLDGLSTECLTCNQGFEVKAGQCTQISCDQSGVYKLSNNSDQCDYCQVNNCTNCSSRFTCDTCSPGLRYDYFQGKCISNCSSSQYLSVDKECKNCSSNCSKCQNSTDCEICMPGFYTLTQTQKVNTDLANLWSMAGSPCLNCSQGCERCVLNYTEEQMTLFLSNTSNTAQMLQPQCWKCAPGYVFDNSTGLCVANGNCPASTYFNNQTMMCEPCPQGCLNCSSLESCSSCLDSYYLNTSSLCTLNSTYISTNSSAQMNATNQSNEICSNNSYFSIEDQICQLCGANCNHCLDQSLCVDCNLGFQLSMFWSNESARQESQCVNNNLTNWENSTWNNQTQSNLSNSTNGTQWIPYMIICSQSHEYFNLDYNGCVSCGQGCGVCKYDGSCIACREGFNLLKTTSGINQCQEICPSNSAQVMKEDGQLSCEICPAGCSKCNQYECLECQSDYLTLENSDDGLSCVEDCPDGYFLEPSSKTCSRCDTSCATCKSSGSNGCTTCKPNYILSSTDSSCSFGCDTANKYLNLTDKQCYSCSENCLTCELSSSNCSSCNSPLMLETSTRTCKSLDQISCPLSQFVNSETGQCQSCDSSCITCSGSDSNQCLSCQLGLILSNSEDDGHYCKQGCEDGTFLNESNYQCEVCPNNCSACEFIEGQVFCTSCSANFAMTQDSQCLESCPDSSYLNEDGICVQCRENCLICNADSCTSCSSGFSLATGIEGSLKLDYLKSQCFEASLTTCPYGTYFYETDQQCHTCDAGCLSCNSTTCLQSCDSDTVDCINNSSFALQCQSGYYLNPLNNSCISKCESVSGLYTSLDSVICQQCFKNCGICDSSDSCTECVAGHYLFHDQSQCIMDCSSPITVSPFVQSYYSDFENQTCNQCDRGCLKCQSMQSQCQICQPFSIEISYSSSCQCVFNHQVQVIPSRKEIRIIAHDIQWAPSVMNRNLPCYVYLQARRNQTNMCLPWYESYRYFQYGWDFESLSYLGFSYHSYSEDIDSEFLKGLNCQLTVATQIIKMRQLPLDYQDQVSELIVSGLTSEHVAMIQARNISFQLNNQYFARPNCDDSWLTYDLQFKELPIIDGKFYDNTFYYSNNTYDNQSSTSSNGYSNYSYSPVDLILNQQDFEFYTCPQAENQKAEILFWRGFDSGFKQLYWQFDMLDQNSVDVNTVTYWDMIFMNMSNSTNATQGNQNTSDFNNESIPTNQTNSTNATTNSTRMRMLYLDTSDYAYVNYTQIQNFLDSLARNHSRNFTMDLSQLLSFIPEEVLVLRLNLTLFAQNGEGAQVKKNINITLYNYPKTQMNADDEITLVPQEFYSPKFSIEMRSCNISKNFEIIQINDQNDLLENQIFLMCEVHSKNNVVLIRSLGCQILPWSLYPYDDYIMSLFVYHYPTKQSFTSNQLLNFSEFIPSISIREGSSTIQDPSQSLYLSSLINYDIDITWYRVQWSCSWFSKQDGTQGNYSPQVIKNQSPYHIYIQPETLQYNHIYFFTVSISSRYSEDILSSSTAQVETVYSSLYNSPQLYLYYDRQNPFNTIDTFTNPMVNFSCSVYSNQTQEISITWTLLDKNTFEVVDLTETTILSQANKSQIQIPSDLFLANTKYELSCEFLNFRLKQNDYEGSELTQLNFANSYSKTKMIFSTDFFQNQDEEHSLLISIDPEQGDAYTTQFQIEASATSQEKLVCTLQSQSANHLPQIFEESTEYLLNNEFSLSLSFPEGAHNIFLICRNSNGYQWISNKTISTVFDGKNMTQVNLWLLNKANNSDPSQVSDMLYFFLNLNENLTQIEDQVKYIFLSNALRVLFITDQNVTDEQMASAIEPKNDILSQITDVIINFSALSNNYTLIQLVQDSYIYTTLFADLNQSMGNSTTFPTYSLETRQNSGVVTVFAISDKGLNKSADLASKLITLGEGVNIPEAQNAQIISAFISNFDQSLGYFPANYTVNGTFENVTFASVKLKNSEVNDNYTFEIPSLSSSSPTKFTIDLSQEDVKQNAYTIIKGNSFSRESISISLEQSQTNTSYYLARPIRRFASDILILSLDNSDYELADHGVYNLNKTVLANSTVQFEVIIDQGFEITNKTIEHNYECRYYDPAANDWRLNECQIEGQANEAGSYKCCSNHLSQFAVIEVMLINTTDASANDTSGGELNGVIEYTDNQFVRIVTITFDVFFIAFTIIGCILDRTTKLTLYLEGSNDRKQKYEESAQAVGGITEGNFIRPSHPVDGYGSKVSADREYEKWYQANKSKIEQQKDLMWEQSKTQVAANTPNQINNQLSPNFNQSLDSGIPILDGQNIVGRPMDPKVRPPHIGHKVSEQDIEEESSQNDRNQRKNKRAIQYEGGSSEDEYNANADSSSKAMRLRHQKTQKQKTVSKSRSDKNQQKVFQRKAKQNNSNQQEEEDLEVKSYAGSQDLKNPAPPTSGIEKQMAKKQVTKKISQNLMNSRANSRTIENSNNNSQNPAEDTVSDQRKLKQKKQKSRQPSQENEQQYQSNQYDGNNKGEYLPEFGAKSNKDYKDSNQDSGDNSSSAADHDLVKTEGEVQGNPNSRLNNSRGSKAHKVMPSKGALNHEDSDSDESIRNQKDAHKRKKNKDKMRGVIGNDSNNKDYLYEDEDKNHQESGARVLQGPNDRSSNAFLNTQKNQTIQGSTNYGSFTSSYYGGCELYGRAIKCYSRTAGLIYREAPHQSRYTRVAAAVAQFFFVLLLTGLLVVEAESSGGQALIVTLLIMRIVQILFNLLPSKQEEGTSVNCRNIFSAILFTIFIILFQIVSMRIERDQLKSLIEDWQRAFIPTFFLEFLIFDFIITPAVVVMLVRGCCSCCSRVIYNFLSPTLTGRYLSYFKTQGQGSMNKDKNGFDNIKPQLYANYQNNHYQQAQNQSFDHHQ